jgi:uncharacterized membrane protein YphA (DoxX/SURF4 family)
MNRAERVMTPRPFGADRQCMETALWTAQVLLAAIFLATGLTKLT